MNPEVFQSLPTKEIAQLVREAEPKVCVLPLNGSRRWLVLEHPGEAVTDFVGAYLRIFGQRALELYQMCFEHGIDTILSPIFGPGLLERGDLYRSLVTKGLLWIARDRDFLSFYDAFDVRVRVYGDSRRYFQNTPYASVLDAYDELAERTAAHDRHRLFFGICAHDAAETVAEIGVRHCQEFGCLPDRRQIVEAYYGEYVEPVDLFIGFGRPAVFDMPLVATGGEDLYFTISPSPYLNPRALRAILYDHLYARRVDESDYTRLSTSDRRALAEFYARNRHGVLGLGSQDASGRFWLPLPQVQLWPRPTPDSNDEETR